MPGFRNRLVLELARGLRGFLNLDVGLTRSAVPSIEALEAQAREQKNKLTLSWEQLDRRDRRIEEQKRELEALGTKTRNDPLEIALRKVDRIGIFRDLLGIYRPEGCWTRPAATGSSPWLRGISGGKLPQWM